MWRAKPALPCLSEKYHQETLQQEVASRLLHEWWICSVMLDSLQFPGLELTRLLCPFNFLCESTGVGLLFPSPGVLPDPLGLNTGLPHCSRHFTLLATMEAHQIHWKVSYLTKAVLEFKSRMKLLCLYSCLDAATTQVSRGEMTAFACQIPNPNAQKDISLQFQSHVNTFLGHNVLSVNADFYMCVYPAR